MDFCLIGLARMRSLLAGAAKRECEQGEVDAGRVPE